MGHEGAQGRQDAIRSHSPQEQQALEGAGVYVPTSCQAGLCGSCKTDYIAGDVEHNDYILNDDEHRSCLTLCVSRARSPLLVLDL